jgi:hypothetical protein
MRSRSRGNLGLPFVGLVLLCGAGCACSAPAPAPAASPAASPAPAAPSAVVQPSDLAAMAGEWRGSLTYLDYTSGKSTSIPVKAVGKVTGDGGRSVTLHVAYPDEPGHDGDQDYTISADGRAVGGLPVVERAAAPDGAVRVVLEEKGTDGNERKPATFRHVLLASPTSLTITKLVKPEGAVDFFERNSYRLQR